MKKSEPANIIFDLNGVIFGYDPINYAAKLNISPKEVIYTLEPGLKTLKECAEQLDDNGNKLHKIYILSNWSQPGFNIIKELFQEVFTLFDGYVVSGDSMHRKPDQKIFEEISDKYNLENQRCIFIDDAQTNIVASEKFGWIGILYDNPNHVRKTLKALNIFS